MSAARWRVDGILDAYQRSIDDVKETSAALQVATSIFGAAGAAFGIAGATGGTYGLDSVAVLFLATLSVVAAALALVRNDRNDIDPAQLVAAALDPAVTRQGFDDAVLNEYDQLLTAARYAIRRMRRWATICMLSAVGAGAWMAVAAAKRVA